MCNNLCLYRTTMYKIDQFIINKFVEYNKKKKQSERFVIIFTKIRLL